MAVKRRNTEVRTPKTPSPALESLFDWNQTREIQLFTAIIYNKPAGMDKHFNMAAIHSNLLKMGNFEGLTSDAIWERMEKYFNLQRSDSIENALKIKYQDKIEFSLPSKEFGKAMADMQKKNIQSQTSKSEGKKGEKNPKDPQEHARIKETVQRDPIRVSKTEKALGQSEEFPLTL